MNKRFSKKLLDKHDKITKQFVIDNLPFFLEVEYPGLVLFENGNKYGVDLVGVTTAEKVVCVEVEHKLDEGWENEYPYEDIRIPYRKLKFAQSEDETLFVLVNYNFTRMALIPATTLLEIKPTKINTRYVRGEDFFCIPTPLVRFFEIPDGKKESSEQRFRQFKLVQDAQEETGQGQPQAQSGDVQELWGQHEKRGL